MSNLPLSATAEGLTTRFGKFGAVHCVTLDAAVRANRRIAFVEMETRADAHRAIAALNLSDFDGCLVSVNFRLAGASEKPS